VERLEGENLYTMLPYTIMLLENIFCSDELLSNLPTSSLVHLEPTVDKN
jgi:hypothetical protein